MARRLQGVTQVPWFARHLHAKKRKARPRDHEEKGGEKGPEGSDADLIEEEIDEAGRESFPASDPPAWTLGIEPHPHHEGKA